MKKGALLHAGLFFTILIFRSPSLFYSVIDSDEAWYYSMAKILLRGGHLYRNAVDLKPPFILYYYQLGLTFYDSMFVVHLLTIIWVMVTSLVIYNILKMTKHKNAAFCGAILYCLYSAAFWPKSTATNCEILMNLPISLAVFYFVKYLNNNKYLYCFYAGLFVAFAALFKYQAILIVPAFIITAVYKYHKEKSFTVLFKSGIIAGLGFIIPYFVILVYYYYAGIWDHAIFWAWDYNYIFLKGFNWDYFWMKFIKVVPKFLLLWSFLWILIINNIRKMINEKDVDYFNILMVSAFLFSMIAIMVGGKFFGHYFIQVVFPAVVLAAPELYKVLFFCTSNIFRVFIISIALLVPVISLGYAWSEGARTRKGNAIIYEISKFIINKTKLGEKLFYWGHMPELFVYTKRIPASRFVTSNFLVGKNTYNNYSSSSYEIRMKSWNMLKKYLITDLQANKPKIIIDTAASNWRDFGYYKINKFPELMNYINEYYSKIAIIKSNDVYLRIK